MPSLQTALPPELANNLYRECLRRAKYIGHQIGNYVCNYPGLMKLNTDGLLLGKLGLAGVGGVLKYSFSFSIFAGIINSNFVPLLAALKALVISINRDMMIGDRLSFRKSCDQVVFFHTLLEGSSMADLLARQGVQRPSDALNGGTLMWNWGTDFGSQLLLWYVQHNTELLVNMVRQQFKRNKHETDPEKIQKLKDDAARGLINHILYEAERLSGRRTIKSI
ncbi:hypothetical protein NC652_021009 [Populus alba x Populus x berolinensis]|nr:hypothetical protein NC652_021009 [Populus alba x Populus x berolinensis]